MQKRHDQFVKKFTFCIDAISPIDVIENPTESLSPSTGETDVSQ